MCSTGLRVNFNAKIRSHVKIEKRDTEKINQQALELVSQRFEEIPTIKNSKNLELFKNGWQPVAKLSAIVRHDVCTAWHTVTKK